MEQSWEPLHCRERRGNRSGVISHRSHLGVTLRRVVFQNGIKDTPAVGPCRSIAGGQLTTAELSLGPDRLTEPTDMAG